MFARKTVRAIDCEVSSGQETEVVVTVEEVVKSLAARVVAALAASQADEFQAGFESYQVSYCHY